jgi:ATP-dependent DNA helicase RecG
LQQANRIYFDEAPTLGFGPSINIDKDWFEEFRALSGLSASISQEQIIKNLRLSLPNGTIKNGAVLFFGISPEQFIETAVIRCIAFEGTNKNQIIDDKQFGAQLIKQYEQVMKWLKGKLDIRYDIKGSGPRSEIWEIPETALKEIIINAICHRDYYDKGAKIKLNYFKTE